MPLNQIYNHPNFLGLVSHAHMEDVLGSVQVKEIEQEVVPERGVVRASNKEGQQKAEEISKRFTGQHFQGSCQI